MARPRRPPRPPKPPGGRGAVQAGGRAVRAGGRSSAKAKATYQARNARARALGYRNYYDYRIHNHGRIPADRPAPTGEARQRLRGHRSFQDLLDTIRAGDLLLVVNWERLPDGRYRWVDIRLVSASGEHDRVFRLRGAQLRREQLRQLVQTIHDRGATVSPSASLDVRRLVDDEEGDEVEYTERLVIELPGGRRLAVDTDSDEVGDDVPIDSK